MFDGGTLPNPWMRGFDLLQGFNCFIVEFIFSNPWMRRFDLLQGFNRFIVEFIFSPSIVTALHLRNGRLIIIIIQIHAK